MRKPRNTLDDNDGIVTQVLVDPLTRKETFITMKPRLLYVKFMVAILRIIKRSDHIGIDTETRWLLSYPNQYSARQVERLKRMFIEALGSVIVKGQEDELFFPNVKLYNESRFVIIL